MRGAVRTLELRTVPTATAQAVNAYVREPRMTADVDIMSPTPAQTAEDLAKYLGARLYIAMRVREVHAGLGYRVYQPRKEGSRHPADVRLTLAELDATTIGGLRFTSPALTVAMKVIALDRRRLAPRGGTDLADIRRLLLQFPELRAEAGAVSQALTRLEAGVNEVLLWRELLAQPAAPDDDEGY